MLQGRGTLVLPRVTAEDDDWTASQVLEAQMLPATAPFYMGLAAGWAIFLSNYIQHNGVVPHRAVLHRISLLPPLPSHPQTNLVTVDQHHQTSAA